jgi:hypothetical protein
VAVFLVLTDFVASRLERDDGTNGNNGTNGKTEANFRLFRYFRLFRHLLLNINTKSVSTRKLKTD